VEDRVAKKQADIERKRAARIVAVHAFRAAGLRQQRISDLLGISQRQVSSNCQLAITANLADSAIVTDAHSLIHMSLGQGATQGEMEAARDWLIAQTDPDYLTQRERARRLTALSIEFVDCADRWRSLQLPDSWKGSDEARADVLRALEPIETCIAQVKRRLQ
jgi:predicted XRE-type DNA-binding protein